MENENKIEEAIIYFQRCASYSKLQNSYLLDIRNLKGESQKEYLERKFKFHTEGYEAIQKELLASKGTVNKSHTELLSTLLEMVQRNLDFFIVKLNELDFKETEVAKHEKKKGISLPHQIALLNELGFFDIDCFKTMTADKRNKIIAKLLNTNTRSVKGNIYALDPNSNENLSKYTSYNYIDEVKSYLSKL